MKKTILMFIITLLAFLKGGAALAGDFYDHLDYGVEWGYTATLQYQHSFVYLSESGSRTLYKGNLLTYKSNGEVLVFAGVKFAKVLTLNACAGWAGVYEGRRVCPLTLRLSCFPRGYSSDGVKILLEGGKCFAKSFEDKEIMIAKIGAGYRITLSHNIALDFSLNAQMVSDHPLGIYDAEHKTIVDDASLLESNAHYSGLSFVMSLSF